MYEKIKFERARARAINGKVVKSLFYVAIHQPTILLLITLQSKWNGTLGYLRHLETP